MTQEDKQLLLEDLCARLPYGVMVKAIGWDVEKNQDVEVAVRVYSVNTDGHVEFGINDYDIEEYLVDDCKPYLRPLSSMTEEEKKSLPFPWVYNFGEITSYIESEGFLETTHKDCLRLIDFFNKKMFDYRGLIPKDLAIEITEDNKLWTDYYEQGS